MEHSRRFPQSEDGPAHARPTSTISGPDSPLAGCVEWRKYFWQLWVQKATG